MQVTPKKNTVISYLPQEIRETTYTDIIYRPVTREINAAFILIPQL